MLRAESHRDHRSTSYLGTSPTSSSSSLSTKEQRSKQLQILQQQQQRLSQQYRQQQPHSQAYSLNGMYTYGSHSIHTPLNIPSHTGPLRTPNSGICEHSVFVLPDDKLGLHGRTTENTKPSNKAPSRIVYTNLVHLPAIVSGRVSPLSFTLPTAGQMDTRRKDMEHTGAKENRKLENEGYPSQDRRQSHMSDRHMRLLSDETPPDDLDGSWGLDNLDDDYSLSRASQIQELQDHHTFNDNTPFNEQNDSNIAKNNDTPTSPQQRHNDRKSTTPSRTNGEKRLSLDMSLRSNSSSTYIRKSSLPHDNTNIDHNNDKFPWRDSKLDNIFTGLVENGTQERSPQQPTSGQGDQDRSGTSSSLSFGDIMDALNNGEESYDAHTRTTKQAKLEQAKQRLVELMPNVQVSPISKESVGLGSTPRNNYRVKSVMNTPGSHHSSGSRPPLSSYSSYRRSMVGLCFPFAIIYLFIF